MAAHIEQKGVSVLNQTGLAQKFGAVTGHVRIADRQASIHAMRIPAGEAHLLIGADLVVSASNEALAKLKHEHSHAVINSHLSPTAEFTRNPDAAFPASEMEQAIASEIEDGCSHFVDATTIATRLLGDAIFANFFLLGAAYQQGLIPISTESITAAIELNAVAVEKNRQAFLWGRRYVDDTAGVRREAGMESVDKSNPEPSSLDDLIASRSEFLVNYQDKAYAKRYQRLLEQVREVENKLQTQAADAELPLTIAVAQAYFKLLAYKDEYEVARLYSNGDFEKSLAAQFEGDFHLSFHLAPPIFAKHDSNTGKPLKREFGGWMLPLLRILARCKGLRGSALDVFGYSAERKMERALIAEYEEDIELILEQINPNNLALAVEMAELPLQMRGFGHVKQASIDSARQRHGRLSRQLSGRDIAVELFSP